MIIQKEYKFYAAHRNEELHDKCRNLHGHRYGMRCFFEVKRTGSYTTLFGDFDAKIEPLLKQEYDHGMLIHWRDPLYDTLRDHMRRTGEELKLKVFDRPTSVENLAHRLFSEITEFGFQLVRLEIRETDTSVLDYTRDDWEADNRRFANEVGSRVRVPTAFVRRTSSPSPAALMNEPAQARHIATD
jgi:6-pyruvoyltetrahydropterin/6-carboxytetrahydropterin synthase